MFVMQLSVRVLAKLLAKSLADALDGQVCRVGVIMSQLSVRERAQSWMMHCSGRYMDESDYVTPVIGGASVQLVVNRFLLDPSEMQASETACR